MKAPVTLSSAGVKLLAAGVVTSLICCAAGVPIVWLVVSTRAGVSALTGAILGLAAMALSHAIVTRAWRLEGLTTLAVAMAAYALSVIGVIAGLTWINKRGDLTIFWVAAGVVWAVFTYTVGLAVTYPRMRILLYTDQEPVAPDEPPSHTGDPGESPSHGDNLDDCPHPDKS